MALPHRQAHHPPGPPTPPGPPAALGGSEVLDALPLAIAVLDAERRIVAWNAAAEALLGWPAAVAVGQPISMLVDDARAHEQEAAFRWVRTSRRTFEYEAVRRDAHGEAVTMMVTVTPLLRHGDIGGYVVTGAPPPEPSPSTTAAAAEHAVAELRARNGELAAARARLEAELHDTRQRHQRLRRAATALVDDLSRALGALGEELGLLAGEVPNGPAGEALASARRAHAAATEALADARRPSGGLGEALRQTSLPDLVDELVHAMAATLRAADATVHVTPGASVDVDPDALAPVLRELLHSACRHRAPERPLHIDVVHEAVGDVDLVRVLDTGVDLDPADLERVFATDAPPAPAPPGLRTGLASVRAAVEELGGRVWAEDAPEGGATIAIALPARRAPS